MCIKYNKILLKFHGFMNNIIKQQNFFLDFLITECGTFI